MGLIVLVFLVVALVLVGVGFAVGLVACVVGACLLGAGVVSSSVFVGVASRRLALGVRAFLLQCGVLAGLASGVVGSWLVWSWFSLVDGITWAVVGSGALGGAAGGAGVAWLIDLSLRRSHRWAAAECRP